MDCQICQRQREPLEPVYRMRLSLEINGRSLTSICQKCLDGLERSKYLSLRERFGSRQLCEACGRPVYIPVGSKATRVVCSPECRSATGSGRVTCLNNEDQEIEKRYGSGYFLKLLLPKNVKSHGNEICSSP